MTNEDMMAKERKRRALAKSLPRLFRTTRMLRCPPVGRWCCHQTTQTARHKSEPLPGTTPMNSSHLLTLKKSQSTRRQRRTRPSQTRRAQISRHRVSANLTLVTNLLLYNSHKIIRLWSRLDPANCRRMKAGLHLLRAALNRSTKKAKVHTKIPCMKIFKKTYLG